MVLLDGLRLRWRFRLVPVIGRRVELRNVNCLILILLDRRLDLV